MHTGKCQHTLTGHTDRVITLIALPNGCIASGSDDITIKIWDVSGKCVRTLKGHKRCIRALTVLRNGHLVSGGRDGTIHIWNMSTGNCIGTLKGHTHAVTALAVLPNGCIASASYDKTIRLWEISTGKCTCTLKGHTGMVRSLVVLPNGRLASCSDDKTVKVWNISNGVCEYTLEGHTHFVLCLVVLPNSHIASTGGDKTIRIWDISKRKCVRILKTSHTHSIYALVVLPSGRLASGSWDRTIRIWDMPTSQLAAKAQRSAQLIGALKSYVATHPNADPVAAALQANLPSVANYLCANGFEDKTRIFKSEIAITSVKSVIKQRQAAKEKRIVKPAILVKALGQWNNQDVLKWLSTLNLGSKRAQYLKIFADLETMGEDLLDAAAKGKDRFRAEMKEDYGITRVFARRMFRSLHALGLLKPVVTKSAPKTESQTGMCVWLRLRSLLSAVYVCVCVFSVCECGFVGC